MKPSTGADTFRLEVPNENIVMIKGLLDLTRVRMPRGCIFCAPSTAD